ncbi:uncharacterized protein APUU_30683A [Aspergillus puulaauensis]|uniref:Uncharacterized protein n=1 Tax=Aspergillus puulaauensis TaxID=1220207 RepID=A0A7R7XK47_9EURO|nr:uncharacterized protein APUU_30683A [Aspergillus puulaauensis]BCS22458.1 hypothetical protein APUU_30683A [Aspergillus puulaauensis]
MAWYSILPSELIYIESWVVRFFLCLGLVTIFPWITLIIFDMVLYTWRLLKYYTQTVGGRAQGMQRPRAPSLNELPDRYGLSAAPTGSNGGGEVKEKENPVGGGVDPDGGGVKRRGGWTG